VANIKSQIKRNRQNEKARLRNKSVKSSLKTVIRKLNEASESGNNESAITLLRDASRQLDKAASKGVIHKNQAANRKSAIAKRIASATRRDAVGRHIRAPPGHRPGTVPVVVPKSRHRADGPKPLPPCGVRDRRRAT
jgi:small subunit ribosomal protein S20